MQENLFPELGAADAAGCVYLMTDGYKLKFGFTSRGSPRPRSGELRAQVIGFMPGTRADEKAYLRHVAAWSIGGEWFSVPDDQAALRWLMTVADQMGHWKGARATDALIRVIAANLRRAA